MWRNPSVCDLSTIIFVWVGRKTEIELPSENYHVHSDGNEDLVKDDTWNGWILNVLMVWRGLSKRKGRALLQSDAIVSQDTERIVRGRF